MARRFLVGCSLVFVTYFCLPASAADLYRIDPAHAWISFSIKHTPWAHYLGMFHSINGIISFDHSDVTASTIEAHILPQSIDTSNTERDQGELQSAGFLDSAKHPDITFKSTQIKKIGDSEAIITGDFSMNGFTVPVAIDTTFNGEKLSPWNGQMTAGFSATGTLDTNDFGMTGLVPLKIGPKVDFRLEIEAAKCGLSCGDLFS
jgi:polyisoprenoid-binding protein YceI